MFLVSISLVIIALVSASRPQLNFTPGCYMPRVINDTGNGMPISFEEAYRILHHNAVNAGLFVDHWLNSRSN